MIKKKLRHNLTGGQAVVKVLEKEKVNYVFGLIGSATMEIFDSLYKNAKIKFIGVRDERTGTHMADGYARASGKAGIVLAGQNGPGSTNLVTGVAQAYKAFSPVISLAGDVSTKHYGKDTFQEINQQSLFEPITKKTFTIKKTSEIKKILSNSFKIATTPRMGPVHVNLPRDILSNTSNFSNFSKHKKNNLPKANISEILSVIKIINNSNKPAIIAGGGIKNSNSEKNLIKFSKFLNIPIVSAAGHGDVIPFNEKLYGGQMGPRGNSLAKKLLKEADVILAFGTRLGFNSTFFSYEYLSKKASIIQIDIENSSLGRYYPIKIGICADVKNFIDELYKEYNSLKKIPNFDKWSKKFIIQRKEFLANRDNLANLKEKPIHPSGLFKILSDNLPKSSAITLDAGTLCLQATDIFKHYKSLSLFTPLDFGLVGFSFACGLGVKLANPKRTVISLIGDGGFGMTVSELSTAVKYKINTITIVLNNKSWGAEKAYQRDFFNKRYIGADISSPRFDKLAKLYGAEGIYVEKLSSFKTAIKKALKKKKPTIINVQIDPNALYSFRKDSFQNKK